LGSLVTKETGTAVKMKTEHFQPALRSLSGHSTGTGDTAGTNRLRNAITAKEMDKLALQSTATS